MLDEDKLLQHKHSIFNNALPTIGLLIEEISGVYQAGLWPGIVKGSGDHHLNCVCFTGGTLQKSPNDPWQYQRNVLFDFAEKYPLDGLIISGSLVGYVDDGVKNSFLHRFSQVPRVSLTRIHDKIPAVYVDNKKGMKELLKHLVEDHNYRSFAYITGPLGNSEADERLVLLRNLLGSYGISLAPGAVYRGNFTRECGATAIEGLRERLSEYDVLLTADDQSALGAMASLHDLGVRIPDQLAVVGFDDVEESKFVTPPLTTVRQPLFELGQKAVELVWRLINKKQVALENVLSARLIMRESCGCNSFMTVTESFDSYRSCQPVLLSSLSSEIVCPNILLPIHFTHAQNRIDAHQFIVTFCHDVNKRGSELCLKTFNDTVSQYIVEQQSLEFWTQLFSSMVHYCSTHLDEESFRFANNLLHEVKNAFCEFSERAQGYQRLQCLQEHMLLHGIRERIAKALSLQELLNVVVLEFPRLGVKTFFMALYNQQFYDLSGAWLELGVIGGKRIIPPCTPWNFTCHDILPEKLVDIQDSAVVVIEPLYFQDTQFGFAVFEKGNIKPDLFVVLGECLSSALHSCLLIDEIEKR